MAHTISTEFSVEFEDFTFSVAVSDADGGFTVIVDDTAYWVDPEGLQAIIGAANSAYSLGENIR